MIHENLEFHNVVELEPAAGGAGLCLRRFPAAVRNSTEFDEHGVGVTRLSSGCEIRFVTESPEATVRLSREDGKPGTVMVCKGVFIYGEFPLQQGEVTEIRLKEPANIGYSLPEAFAGQVFSPKVWRVFSGSVPLVFHGIDTGGKGVRPPAADEKPKIRWLAYGSSVTMNGPIFHNYVNYASQLLRVDALNLGMAGACFMQRCVADDIAGRSDWDFATLELGVNMRSQFEPEEFERRARYMIPRILKSRPRKPVFVITALRNHNYFANEKNVWTDHQNAYNGILRAVCREARNPYLHIIEGIEVSPDFTGYKADMLHPAGLATFRIAQCLAERLVPALRAAGLRI